MWDMTEERTIQLGDAVEVCSGLANLAKDPGTVIGFWADGDGKVFVVVELLIPAEFQKDIWVSKLLVDPRNIEVIV